MAGDFDIRKTTLSDQENRVDNWEVTALETDGPSDLKETEWITTDWSTYWGYFNEIEDLKSAIIMKAIWNVGKGYTTDSRTRVLLEGMSGWGKDTFDDIIFNMEIIKRVNGDSYAEIIRNPDTGALINLKPLDPSTIRIVLNRQGIIIRYEKIRKVNDKNIVEEKFQPEEIFHLSNNRLADQIHGISDIKGMEDLISAEKESFEDIRKIMHRQARPLIVFKIGTDVETEIDAIISKLDKATNLGENVYIPDDDNSLSYEVVQVNVSQLVLNWRDDIRNKFYRTIGLPQVVPGAGGNSTESESKVIYFAFEQIVEKDQRFLEKQIWNQLAIRINFIPPATLAQDLQSDEAKDGALQVSQPQDTNLGVQQNAPQR